MIVKYQIFIKVRKYDTNAIFNPTFDGCLFTFKESEEATKIYNSLINTVKEEIKKNV